MSKPIFNRLLKLAQGEHADEFMALEAKLVRSFSRTLADNAMSLESEILALFIAEFGDVTYVPSDGEMALWLPVVTAKVQENLSSLNGVLTDHQKAAIAAGANLAANQLAVELSTEAPELKEIGDVGVEAAKQARESKLTKAVAKKVLASLAVAQGEVGLMAALTPVKTLDGKGAAAISYAVNQGGGISTEIIVDKISRNRPGMMKLWVAERDACVHCLAYSGMTTGYRGEFPDDLTFGDRPIPQEHTLKAPPLHPHCRCKAVPWNDAWRTPGEAVSAPEALQREAVRSVLKGWALDSESNAARMRAAQRLLNSGPNIPKTVIEEAQRSLRKGWIKKEVP